MPYNFCPVLRDFREIATPSGIGSYFEFLGLTVLKGYPEAGFVDYLMYP